MDRHDLRLRIGARVREAREALGKTQEEFGSETGRLGAKVSDVERGLAWPPVDWMMRLYETYRITPDFLVLGYIEALPSELRDRIKALRKARKKL